MCTCLFHIFQGRSFRESTLKQAQRRSFTPASFMEEDMVDFPDELDTSFFARVRPEKTVCYVLVSIFYILVNLDLICKIYQIYHALFPCNYVCFRISCCKRSCLHMPMRCLSRHLRWPSKRQTSRRMKKS